MSTTKKLLHSMAIALSRQMIRFIPDRVPMTFIGADATRELCASLAQTGAKKLLVVTDAGLVDVGIAGRVTDCLESAGLAYSVYSGVEPDPTFAQVRMGLDQLSGEGCDGVLAVGGGSSMDAAKIIAATATNGGDPRKLEGMMKVKQPTVPFSAIPTTAGTGSEVTLAAVISETDTHTKRFFADPKLLPDRAALDPTLMTGLPPAITAATGMDALTHAVESYVATTSNPQTERWAEAAVRLIFAQLPEAYANGSNLEARKAMALASYYAGLAFTRTSVGYVHAIAHTFGAYYRTPHGLANAVALPHVLEFSLPEARSRLAALADVLGLPETGEAERAAAFIDAVRDLMGKVGIAPTLDAIKREDIPSIAEQALAEAHATYPVPRYMEQAACEQILARIAGAG